VKDKHYCPYPITVSPGFNVDIRAMSCEKGDYKVYMPIRCQMKHVC